MKFLKDDVALLASPLAPQKALAVPPQAKVNQRAIAGLYNRIGGLLDILGGKTGVDVETVLSVWSVESGGIPFAPNRAAVRLEVHRLYELWGAQNRPVFDSYFRFGGHSHQAGRPWQNHEFRSQDSGVFHAVHHNQSSEYAALTLAQVIAGDETAFASSSIGGCQLMMNAHLTLGYRSAKDMYDAFQKSEMFHVLAFFDFCRTKNAPGQGDLFAHLKARDWNSFAKYYNGAGQVPVYAARLKAAYDVAAGMVGTPKAA